jgi:hypothetical protein
LEGRFLKETGWIGFRTEEVASDECFVASDKALENEVVLQGCKGVWKKRDFEAGELAEESTE